MEDVLRRYTVNDTQLRGRLTESINCLIHQHFNVTKLLCEVSGETQHQDVFGAVSTVDTVLEAIQNKAKAASTSQALVVLSLLGQQLHKITSASNHTSVLPRDDKKSFELLCKAAKRLEEDNVLSLDQLPQLLQEQTYFPLEALLLLNQYRLLTFHQYMTHFLVKSSVIGDLVKDIVTLCIGDEDTHARRWNIVKEYISFFFLNGFTDSSDLTNVEGKNMMKVCVTLLDSVAKTTDAVKLQDQWISSKADLYKVAQFRQVLVLHSAKAILQVLLGTLQQKDVNWQTVLTFTSVYLITIEKSDQYLQDAIRSFLCEALQQLNRDNIVVGFLLARQASLEGPHVFIPYQQWFQSLFGDPKTSVVNTKKSFTFLLKVLADFVPFEHPLFLKAHLMKCPHTPPGCRPILMDYVSLAKTRLQDLHQPMEELGIFQRDEQVENILQQVQADVEVAMSSYERTGRVPASLMEASIVRKPYFIGRFLPALLTPYPFPSVPDVRMKLIEGLRRADKIPTVMYAKYEMACQKAAQQLVEGISFDDDDMEEMLLSSWQQFCKSLDVLGQAVIKSYTNSDRSSDISSKLSVFKDKLLQFMDVDNLSQAFTICLEADALSVKPDTLKVVDKVLEMVAGAVKESVKSWGDVTVDMSWMNHLLNIVGSVRDLSAAFHARIWELVVKQGHSLKTSHIECLSTVCYHMTIVQLSVTVRKEGDEDNFLNALFCALPLSSTEWMLFSVRFVCAYLSSFMRSCPDETSGSQPMQGLPGSLFTQFAFIYERCQFMQLSTAPTGCSYSHQFSEVLHLAEVIRQYEPIKERINSMKAMFIDNMLMELKVCPYRDLLDDHQKNDLYWQYISDEANRLYLTTCECVWQSSIALACIVANVHPVTGKPCLKNAIDSQRTLLRTFLQELLYDLTSENHEDELWALTFLQHISGVLTTGDAQGLSITVTNGVDLLLELSPHLFYVNNFLDDQWICEKRTPKMVQLFNSYFSLLRTDGAVLPKSVTKHIVQGMVMCKHLSVKPATMLDTCPLVACSVQFHWGWLRNTIPTSIVQDRMFGQPFMQAECIYTTVQRIPEDYHELSTMSQSHPHLCAYAVFHFLLLCSNEDTTQRALQLLSRESSSLLEELLHVALRKLASVYLYIGAASHKIATFGEAGTHDQGVCEAVVIGLICKASPFKARVITEEVTDSGLNNAIIGLLLLPFIYLRLLQRVPVDMVVASVVFGDILQYSLDCLLAVYKLYDQGTLILIDTFPLTDLVSLQFLISAEDLVCSLLSSASINIKRKLHNELRNSRFPLKIKQHL